MWKFQEITSDHGCAQTCYASDNNATYIITSARGHEMITEYRDKYFFQGRFWPTAAWYHKHFTWKRF